MYVKNGQHCWPVRSCT